MCNRTHESPRTEGTSGAARGSRAAPTRGAASAQLTRGSRSRGCARCAAAASVEEGHDLVRHLVRVRVRVRVRVGDMFRVGVRVRVRVGATVIDLVRHHGHVLFVVGPVLGEALLLVPVRAVHLVGG